MTQVAKQGVAYWAELNIKAILVVGVAMMIFAILVNIYIYFIR